MENRNVLSLFYADYALCVQPTPVELGTQFPSVFLSLKNLV